MYKPGQIITINKVKYRIMKSPYGCVTCDYKNVEPFDCPCNKCVAMLADLWRHKPIKLVKLCGNQDKQ